MWLKSGVAVAVVWASSCSSDSTPSPETSTCYAKKQKKQTKEQKSKGTEQWYSNGQSLGDRQGNSPCAAVSPSDGKCAPRCPDLCTLTTSSQTSPRAPHQCSRAASLALSAEAPRGPLGNHRVKTPRNVLDPPSLPPPCPATSTSSDHRPWPLKQLV